MDKIVMHGKILTEVEQYYTAKLAAHGQSAGGVDWNSHEGQFLRFSQLCKVIPEGTAFSINDLGCGYGALVDYLESKYAQKFTYHGYDISTDMIKAGQERHQKPYCEFITAEKPTRKADYGIASGIFNVMFGATHDGWWKYITDTIDDLDASCSKGFSFNCLTSYSDKDKMKDNLYYADPCRVFDYCKRNYSKQVALLHDYGLYEFTILVRK